jgi:glycosyltransferase involved in cell wall biosynthesis
VLPKLAGSQRISLAILKGLLNSEYRKYVLFSNDVVDVELMFQCKKAFEDAGVTVLFSRNMYREIGLKDVLALIEIYKLCKKERFDIVHTHSTKPGIIGRIAAALAHTPLIIHTVHGLAFHKYVGFPIWQFYWFCEMVASFFCTKIVLVNTYYSKYFKLFHSKLLTIYNGIDFDIIDFTNDRYCRKIRVLFVGRLDTPKDPLTLLQAAKEVIKEEPETCFTLVGDGEKYKECETFIKNNHLEQNITMTGWQSDITGYYKTHHIFISSSIYEAFGLMFIEAGYYKLPVVATNVEGIPEVIEDTVTGLLSPPRCPHLLAQNVLYLIRNNEQRKYMGENGYKRVTSLFDIKRMKEKYYKLYQRRI